MYFYCTFHYFIYRVCILSIQHIPGRYIRYAHSSCCSVHPFKEAYLRGMVLYIHAENTLCTIHPALGASLIYLQRQCCGCWKGYYQTGKKATTSELSRRK